MRRGLLVGTRIWRVGLAVVLASLGLCPAALAANVYVTNFAANSVSQFSVAADGTLVALSPASVTAGTGPQGIALSPDRKSVYVANNTSSNASQYSVAADGTLSPKSPATVAVTRPAGVAVSPDGKSAYFTSQTSGTVAQFDIAADGTLSPKATATVAIGSTQSGTILLNAAGTRAYVGNNNGTVSQLSVGANGSLAPLSPLTVASGGNQSTGLALSPDGASLYAANRGSNSISRFAVSPVDGTLTLGATFAAGGQTNGVTVSADGKSLYAANQQNSVVGQTVSQYTINADGSLTPKTPPTVPSFQTPKMIALSSDGRTAYVPNQTTGDLSLFTVAADGSLTAKTPATVTTAAGAFAVVFSDGPPVVASPPSATTGAASDVTNTGASVTGVVNPHGTATSYTFEYGPSTSFGSITAVSSAGSGGADVAQTAALTGLSPNTTYYYRLVASSSAGDAVGTVRTFRTTGTPVAPAAVTQPATATTNDSATLHAQVNPSGQQTAFTFEYGTSTSFGAITPVVALDDADALEPVSAALTGLAPDTTYYYRVVATNATGTTVGAVLRFSTGPGGAPVVSTGPATAVTATGATLAGTVDAHGSQTAFAFEYGTTTAFGSLSAIDNAGDTNAVQSVTLPVAGLSPGTTYLYRIIATNAGGTTFGAVQTLTTGAAD